MLPLAGATPGLPLCRCGHDLAAHERRGASRCAVRGCRCPGWLADRQRPSPGGWRRRRHR